MKTITVESSALISIAYDSERDVLEVEFCDRSVYQYIRVPAEVYQAFLTAPSKGSYFNRNIRDRFACSRRSEAQV